MSSANQSQRQLIIRISHLPYPELSPNSRVHWAVKARAVKAAREEMGWLAKSQWHDEKPMMKAKISYEFGVCNSRRRDMDNLVASCKSFVDGLIDAGVLFYDDSNHLTFERMDLLRTDREYTKITLIEQS